MKRIAAISFSLALMLLLSVQVFADTDMPQFREAVDSAIAISQQDILEGSPKSSIKLPLGYDYLFVGSIYRDDVTALVLVYSNSPLIKKGDVVYSRQVLRSSANRISFTQISKVSISDMYENGDSTYDRIVVKPTIGSLPVCIKDRSTASFDCANLLNPDGRWFYNVGTNSADLSELQELIAQAEQKNESDYTPESWSVLESALNDAKDMISQGSTQAEVDAMCDRLQAALNGLREKPLPPTEPPTQPTVPPEPPTKPSAPTLPSEPPGPTEPGGHRYMVDGFRLEDLLPAQNAIMENFGEARKFGIFVFVVMIVLFIITRLIRRMLDIDVNVWDEKDGIFRSSRDGVTLNLGKYSKSHPLQGTNKYGVDDWDGSDLDDFVFPDVRD